MGEFDVIGIGSYTYIYIKSLKQIRLIDIWFLQVSKSQSQVFSCEIGGFCSNHPRMEIQSGNRGASPNISKRKRACQIEDFVSLGQTIHFASTFLLRDSILCDTANICRMCISLYTHYTHYIYTVYYTITYTYRQPYPAVADSISFPKTVPMAV